MGQLYIEAVAEWFEAHSNVGIHLTGRQCREIAKRIRSEIPPVESRYCLQPKKHAPTCDCGTLMGPKED
jgi:hypothetical protein